MWNPFRNNNATQNITLPNAATDCVITSTTSGPIGQAGSVYGRANNNGLTVGSGGGNGLVAGSGLILGGQHQIQTIMQQYGQPLSDREREEMNNLKAEHLQSVKRKKLDNFKKINKEVRQLIVNALIWDEYIKDANQVQVEKNPRLQELELKEMNSGLLTAQYIYSGGGTFAIQTAYQYHILNMIGIPEGLTTEDLKQAHIEASLEEEILDGQE